MAYKQEAMMDAGYFGVPLAPLDDKVEFVPECGDMPHMHKVSMAMQGMMEAVDEQVQKDFAKEQHRQVFLKMIGGMTAIGEAFLGSGHDSVKRLKSIIGDADLLKGIDAEIAGNPAFVQGQMMVF